MELHLREYLYEDFVEIVRRILKTKYQMDETLTEKIAYAVWNQLKSKDIRNAINIARLTGSVEDVNWLVQVQMKHAKCPQPM
jgi:hypothetical protein